MLQGPFEKHNKRPPGFPEVLLFPFQGDDKSYSALSSAS